MGKALLDGVPFRLDPSSVSWTYTPKTSSIDTIGGKVIQIYGVTLGDMSITGAFGVGGWREQEGFLKRMVDLANKQIITQSFVRFVYPGKDWDFKVYLKDYSSVQGAHSVHHTPGTFSPKWRLTLFLMEDNIGLKEIAKNAFIERLSQGIGWKRNEFNGPIDLVEQDNAFVQRLFNPPDPK